MAMLSLKITRRELARTLALLRVARGWSQQEVAAASGRRGPPAGCPPRGPGVDAGDAHPIRGTGTDGGRAPLLSGTAHDELDKRALRAALKE
jgi:hypothetical protein